MNQINQTHELKFLVNANNANNSFSKNILQHEAQVKFVKLDKITKQTQDEYLLRFNVPIKHDPGQFMQVSLLGIGEAPISICSQNEEYFEMSIRSVGNVSAHICNLKKGDLVGLRGPYGKGYEMENFIGNNIIIIAGGCGTAPVRGNIEYIMNHREQFQHIDIIFGFRTHNDMLFLEDYKKWEKAKMNIKIALSEETGFKNYKKGFVTDLLEGPMVSSNQNKVVFICGPPIMIKTAADKLLSLGFNKQQIYISEERHMKCGVGRCGHCMINDKYCCTDGPVFRLDKMEGYTD